MSINDNWCMASDLINNIYKEDVSVKPIHTIVEKVPLFLIIMLGIYLLGRHKCTLKKLFTLM